MAITKEIVVDKIEVLEMGHVQVRTATKIIEDGKVLTRTFQRHVLEPSIKDGDTWKDTDISGEDEKVQKICDLTWTDDVKTAYQEKVDARFSLGE